MGNLGFGIAAAAPREIAAHLALELERSGFATFWVNDTPGADGLEVLARVASVTTRIRLGVGVIPIDRRSPTEIAETIHRLDLPADRLAVGLGSGSLKATSVEAVRAAVLELKRQSPGSIAVGALGPRMVEMGARESDLVLLNWLTPAYARVSAGIIREVSASKCQAVAYVRVAIGSGAQQLVSEARRYASFPQYARHFRRMGSDPLGTCVFGESAVIQAGLKSFREVVDETVVRAITGEESLSAYVDVLRAAELAF
jgi:alkanesulfonate monooxygenase SsuD/methylene tetrahydromethanopterin reductase-like flavin-dependent oxidoreductase (luciferase family)